MGDEERSQPVDEREYFEQSRRLRNSFDIGHSNNISKEKLENLRKIGYQPGEQGHKSQYLNILSQREWSEIMNGKLHDYGRLYKVTTDQLYRLDFLKEKLRKLPATPPTKMVIVRARVKRYINQRGLYCARNVPDVLNSLTSQLLENAINRVYLDNRRRTVKSTDFPLFNLYL